MENENATLNAQIKNTQVSADKINADIRFMTGRNDIQLENVNDGYVIKRSGVVVTKLSKGEENLISLIYFFASLENVNLQYKPADYILFFDDPISSFDNNFFYNAMSFIKHHIDRYSQVFLFTHKMSVLKQCQRMVVNSKIYFLDRKNNDPQLTNIHDSLKNFYDEYVYFFHCINDFIKKDNPTFEDSLHYSNLARKLLEAFLSFKVPFADAKKSDLKTKLEKLTSSDFANFHHILRLFNEESHSRHMDRSEVTDDHINPITYQTYIAQLMKLIERYEPIQYEILTSMRKNINSSVATAPIDVLSSYKSVPYYDIAAAAGPGIELFDTNIQYDMISVHNADCDFVIKISGDSMEPDYPDGSLVLVKNQSELKTGDLGIFDLKGKALFKKYVKSAQKTLLISLNKEKYKEHIVIDSEDHRIFGKVIGKHNAE